MDVIVRIVRMDSQNLSQGSFGWKKKHEPVYCSYDSEENEYGVGAGVNATILSETL